MNGEGTTGEREEIGHVRVGTVSGEMWSIVSRRGNNVDRFNTDAVVISRGRLTGEK